MALILHIEDDTTVRILYKEVFEERGYEVVQAADAEEGLKILRKTTPHLIILDLKMPGMGGRGFLKQYRKLNRRIPLVISTAYPYYPYEDEEGAVYPADAFIVKSGDMTALVDAVTELLARGSGSPIP